MQIVLLFAIIEGSIFKFLSLQQNSEKISFLPVLFVLQNSFFRLERLFLLTTEKGGLSED